METTHIFAQRINELREERGLSQGKLADELGISRGALSYYESAQRTADISMLVKFAKYFDVTADYLLGLSDNRTSKTAGIGEATGLSDEAIKKLQDIKNGKNPKKNMKICNSFISSAQFEGLIHEMAAFFTITNECGQTITHYIDYLQERIEEQKKENYIPPEDIGIHDYGIAKMECDAQYFGEKQELRALSYFRAGEYIRRFINSAARDEIKAEKENLQKADDIWRQYKNTNEGKTSDIPPIYARDTLLI